MLRRILSSLLEPIRKNGRHDVATALSKGRVVRKLVGGEAVTWLVTNSGDEIQRQQISDGFYELAELRRLRDDIGLRRRVLDVGANIGNHSIFFARFFGVSSLIAVEPFHSAYRHLLANFALNSPLAADVRILSLALGGVEGSGTIVEPTAFNIGLTRIDDQRAGGTAIRTGDNVIGNDELDLVKIDVEGMELSVLQGMSNIISNQRPAFYIEASEDTRAGVLEILERANYELIRESIAYEKQFNLTLIPKLK